MNGLLMVSNFWLWSTVFLFYTDESNLNPDDHDNNDVNAEDSTTIIETEKCPDRKGECTRKSKTTIEIVCKNGLKDRCSYDTRIEKCQIDEKFCKGSLLQDIAFSAFITMNVLTLSHFLIRHLNLICYASRWELVPMDQMVGSLWA